MATDTYPPATEFFPERLSLAALARRVQGCRACPLYEQATQAVFGEGPASARLMLVGEVPGDREDLQGRPFVGPAGALLDQVLEEVGLGRGEVFVTNAVKHFKFSPRGKRRIHEKPTRTEVNACIPWFEAEVEVVEPAMIVCLGATAAQALLGPAFRITRQRGEVFDTEWAPWVSATWHPSAVLRARDHDRQRLRDELRADFAAAAERYRSLDGGG